MDPSETNFGTLTEESLKRKERLRRLREKANKNGANENDSNKEPLPKPTFRSYKPQNQTTAGEMLSQDTTEDIEKAVEEQLELLNQPNTIDEIDITTLAPRKPDWDLKRDVSKKLERLERRTQKAIAELIRERLKKNQQVNDIFQAVNVGTAHADEPSTRVDE